MLSEVTLPPSLKGRLLGEGCSGRVYSASAGRVVKIAANDMARNWLEFCMHRRVGGGDMTFVPKVYLVIDYIAAEPSSDGDFLAIMDMYQPQDHRKKHYSSYPYDNCLIPSTVPGYLELQKDFGSYMEECGLTNILFNDAHVENIMVDPARSGNQLVLTDPVTGEYYKQTLTYSNSKDSLW